MQSFCQYVFVLLAVVRLWECLVGLRQLGSRFPDACYALKCGKGVDLASWSIAEWYGKDIRTMSGAERRESAEIALATSERGLANVEQPFCPFLATVRPGARCNKPSVVCSIRPYEAGVPPELPPNSPPLYAQTVSSKFTMASQFLPLSPKSFMGWNQEQ